MLSKFSDILIIKRFMHFARHLKKSGVTGGQVMHAVFATEQRAQLSSRLNSFIRQQNLPIPSAASGLTTQRVNRQNKTQLQTSVLNNFILTNNKIKANTNASASSVKVERDESAIIGFNIEDLFTSLQYQSVRSIFTSTQKQILTTILQEHLFYKNRLPAAYFQDSSGNSPSFFSVLTNGTLLAGLNAIDLKDKFGNLMYVLPNNGQSFESDIFLASVPSEKTPDNVIVKLIGQNIDASCGDLMIILQDFGADFVMRRKYLEKIKNKVEKYDLAGKVGSIFIDTSIISYEPNNILEIRKYISSLPQKYQDNIFLTCDLFIDDFARVSSPLSNIVKKEQFFNKVITLLKSNEALQHIDWNNLLSNDMKLIAEKVHELAEKSENGEQNIFTEYVVNSSSYLSIDISELYSLLCNFFNSQSPHLYLLSTNELHKKTQVGLESFDTKKTIAILPESGAIIDLSSDLSSPIKEYESLKINKKEGENNASVITGPLHSNSESSSSITKEDDEKWEQFVNSRDDANLEQRLIRLKERTKDAELRERLNDLKSREPEPPEEG